MSCPSFFNGHLEVSISIVRYKRSTINISASLVKQLFEQKLMEQPPKEIFVPVIIVGTTVKPIIVLTAYYWKSCLQYKGIEGRPSFPGKSGISLKDSISKNC